jgi:hypothetical protein
MHYAQSPCQSPSLVPVTPFTRMLESDRDYIVCHIRYPRFPHKTLAMLAERMRIVSNVALMTAHIWGDAGILDNMRV